MKPNNMTIPPLDKVWVRASDPYKMSVYLIRHLSNVDAAPGRDHEYPVMVHYLDMMGRASCHAMPLSEWNEKMEILNAAGDHLTINSKWRHKKNGTTYFCIAISFGQNNAIYISYQGEDGKIWSKESEAFLEAMEKVNDE